MKLGFKSISVICLFILLITASCEKKPETSAQHSSTATKQNSATKTTTKTASESATTKISTTKENGTNEIIEKTDDTTPDVTPGPEGDDQPGSNDGTNNDAYIEDGPFAGFKFNPHEIDCGGKTYLLFVPGGPPVAGTPEGDRRLRMIEKTEEKFNIKVDYVESAWWTEVDKVKALWLSGMKWADGPFQYNWVMPWGLTKKLFVPVDDYIDFAHERFQDIEKATLWIDGNHYSFLDNADLSGSWIATTFYNTSILESEGLEDILSLYKKNQWNWDKFRAYAIIATRDLNGDGIVDQWGTCEYPPQGNNGLANLLRYSNAVATVTLRQGSLTFSGFEQPFLNALQYYQTLKYIDKVVGGNQQTWLRGNALMVLGPSNFTSTYYKQNLPYQQAPVPVGPDAPPNSLVTYGFPTKLVPAVTDFTPQELIAISTYMDYNDPDDPLIYIDPYDDFMIRTSNPNNSVYMGTEEERLFYYDYYNNTAIVGTDSYLGRDFNTFLGPYLTKIGNGESVASVLDSALPSINSYIDELMAN